MPRPDPGYGDPRAPIGSAEWAKRWRLSLQNVVKDLPHSPNAAKRIYQLGAEHRAWALLKDTEGRPFKDFDSFCRCKQPWGLGMVPASFRAYLAAELGEKAADLITVGRGDDKGGRPRKGEETAASDAAVSQARRKDEYLRAILRAPEVVQQLYRDGLMRQADAARMGPKAPSPERAALVAGSSLAGAARRRWTAFAVPGTTPPPPSGGRSCRRSSMSPDHAVPAHSPDQALDELALEALEDLGPLLSNQQLVEDLQRLLLAAPRNLDGVRQAVSLVLRSQPPAWQRRYDPHRNRKYTCDDFVRFVQGPLPEGLETDVGTLRRLLKDYPEELVLFEQALARGPGGANNPHGTPMVRSEDGTFLERATTIPVNRDVVTVDPHPPLPAREGGNSVSYAIRRLTRERPDLLAKVKAGELSCNAAMIQAGLRRVRAPLQWLRHWWARASPLERETFLKEVLCEA